MRRLVGTAALLATLAAGCDDPFVDPFLRDAAPYSLYGYVVSDPLARTQQVRVQRIRPTADPPTDASEPAALIEGEMTSPDPSGGAPLVWAPRPVTYADGTVGTVFEREFRPLPDSRFEIRFEDLAGRVVTAEVVVPPSPPTTLFDFRLVDERNGLYRQRIVWEGERFLPEATVWYQGGTFEGGADGYSVTYPLRQLDDGRVEIDIDLSADLLRLAALVPPEQGYIPDLKVRATATRLTDLIPPNDVIPTEDVGRTFVQGASTGTVAWAPIVPLPL